MIKYNIIEIKKFKNLIFKKSKVILGCELNEFECACYTPRCIPRSQVRNGVANCADASDELDAVGPRRVATPESEMACADLTLSRKRRPAKQPPLLRLDVSPCSKEAQETCHSHLNQVCVVSHFLQV